MMDRRGFLSSCLALAAAPAIVRADSLMRIVARDTGVVTFSWHKVELGFTIEKPDLILVGQETFSEIISKTFKEHAAQIRDNIEKRNALLRYLSSPVAAVRVDEARATGLPLDLGSGGSFLP